MNGFLETANLQLRAATVDLAADNARARQEKAKRLIAAMEEYADEYGLCNAVGVLANYAEEKEMDAPEGSDAERDYTFARQVLDGALHGVDLAYSSDSAQERWKARIKAVEAVIDLAREIEA